MTVSFNWTVWHRFLNDLILSYDLYLCDNGLGMDYLVYQ